MDMIGKPGRKFRKLIAKMKIQVFAILSLQN